MPQLVPVTGVLLDQVLRETFEIWNEGLSFPQYVRFWQAQLRTAWGAAHLDRVGIVEEGAVTASAKRYSLVARIDGSSRRVLGIGAVFTSPYRRRRGAARRLIETMLERAAVEDYEFAMLFSEIDPDFYEALGFVRVPLLESELRVTETRGSPMILMRVADDRDIAAIAELSATRSASARLALDRSQDWIRYGISKRRLLCGLDSSASRQLEFLVTEEAQRAVAYIVASVHEGGWFIEDAGDRDPSGARVGAMLQAMLARAPHQQPPQIRAWMPQGCVPPQVEIVESRPTAEVLMMRPLQDRTVPSPLLSAADVIYCRLDYF